ncbi:MAG: GNAT family N-acetyltransferase [Verrucomicrobiota bacterium]
MQIETSSIRRAYTSDRRAYDFPNYRREDFGSFVRYTPLREDADGIICFTKVPEHELNYEIQRQCEYFKSRDLSFEWKVYDFDEPSNLVQRLLENGFEQGDEEALMVYDLRRSPTQSEKKTEGIQIREISSVEDLTAIVRIQETIWNRSFPWLQDQLLSMTDSTAYFCAFDGNQPIAAGWIEYPKDSSFAELHGGSVYPEYRGRGIYSELFRIRKEQARAKGVPFISVDAAPMSRPILESKGFIKLSSTYPLTMKLA